MSVRLVILLAAVAALASACKRSASPGSGTAARSADGAPAASPAPRATSDGVGGDGCSGREIHDCARTRGCLLDQPTYRKPRCRAAENACERAVRHADLIGPDADPAVTPAMTAAAEAACAATAGCAATSGHCSCPCSILALCTCDCGGHYLRRCTLASSRAFYEGVPPAEGGAPPLGVIADALVKVRRAPRDRRFVVDPLPPVDALVGKPRHQIQGFLGTGWACGDTTTAPCRSTKQVFYGFYHLPTGSLGGGPELLVTYDDKSICTDARFVHTR